MELDTNKIDDAVLALLLLGLHDGARAWKGFDWDAMNRLHAQGYIPDPRGKAKSVVFTEEGFKRAERLLGELFGKTAEPCAAPESGANTDLRGASLTRAYASATLATQDFHPYFCRPKQTRHMSSFCGAWPRNLRTSSTIAGPRRAGPSGSFCTCSLSRSMV